MIYWVYCNQKECLPRLHKHWRRSKHIIYSFSPFVHFKTYENEDKNMKKTSENGFSNSLIIHKLTMKWTIYWTADMKSSEANPRSYERKFSNCLEKPEKFRPSTGFEPVTSRYRCDVLTKLSHEATDVGSWSFVGSNVPKMNESMIKWYMKWLIYEAFQGFLATSDIAPKLQKM